MATNLLAPVGRQRAITDLGIIAPGALLYTFVSGTPATPLATTSDAAGLVPNTNPLVASAGGLFGPIYLPPGVAYHFKLTDAAGLLIWDQDPVTAGPGTGDLTVGNLTVTGAITVGGGATFTTATGPTSSVTIQNPVAGPNNYAALFVNNDGATQGMVQCFSSTWTTNGPYLASGVALRGTGAGGLSITAEHANGAIRLYTGGLAERIRILSTGEVAINQYTPGPTWQFFVAGPNNKSGVVGVQNLGAAIGGFQFIGFFNDSLTTSGAITQVNAGTVAYNTTSDARLKDDAGRATDAGALRAVVVHDFAWKADGRTDRGVFAQEAHAVCPRAVTVGTDETTERGDLKYPWMTDYSKFVPDLIVGWQAHDTAIADLRAAVAALTGSRS